MALTALPQAIAALCQVRPVSGIQPVTTNAGVDSA